MNELGRNIRPKLALYLPIGVAMVWPAAPGGRRRGRISNRMPGLFGRTLAALEHRPGHVWIGSSGVLPSHTRRLAPANRFRKFIFDSAKPNPALVHRFSVRMLPGWPGPVVTACVCGWEGFVAAIRFLHAPCGKCLTTHSAGLKYRSTRICPKGSGDAL